MEHREELLRQVNQLLDVLKQMLKNGGSVDPAVWADESLRSLTLNICFFDVTPCGEAEVEPWTETAEEVFGLTQDVDPLRFELTEKDLDFLKINGLNF